MTTGNYDTTTELYLVRLWIGKSSDGTASLRGKLQHVVSGAICYFDGLPDLLRAFDRLKEQETGTLLDAGTGIEPSDVPDDEADIC